MSEQKAFAKFPSTGEGYQYVDVFAIEAVGQGGTPELATIFTTGSDRYYLVEVPQAELERAGEPDAATWCLSMIGEAASASLSPEADRASLRAEVDRAYEMGRTAEREATKGPAYFAGDPNMPL